MFPLAFCNQRWSNYCIFCLKCRMLRKVHPSAVTKLLIRSSIFCWCRAVLSPHSGGSQTEAWTVKLLWVRSKAERCVCVRPDVLLKQAGVRCEMNVRGVCCLQSFVNLFSLTATCQHLFGPNWSGRIFFFLVWFGEKARQRRQNAAIAHLRFINQEVISSLCLVDGEKLCYSASR